LSSAFAVAKAALAWSWSLPSVPNLYMAQAHRALGQLYEMAQDTLSAMTHFYAELAVVRKLPPEGPLQGAIESCEIELAKAAERLGYPHADELRSKAQTCFDESDQAYERGWAQLTGGQQGAATEFQQALSWFPFHPYALFGLGVCHMQEGDLTTAMELFNQTLDLLPKHEEARLNRAELLRAAECWTDALEDVDAVLSEDEGHTPARMARARILMNQGHHEDAKADLTRLLKVEDSPAARVLRAECHLESGDSASAKQDLQRAIEMSPEGAEQEALRDQLKQLSAGTQE
jgi:tetratricopeptide (TPR) repeat protein